MKTYSYEPSKFLQRRLGISIRGNLDIIRILVYVIRDMLASDAGPRLTDVECDSFIVLAKDGKMSRLFIKLNTNYYYSFVFPFQILLRDGEFKIYHQDIFLNNKLLSVIIAIIESSDLTGRTILDEMILQDEITPDEEVSCLAILNLLLTVELGYVRYEKDKVRQDKDFHPLYHLDVNCTDDAKYKFGLNKPLSFQCFLDLLNDKKKRYYLSL